MRRWLIAITLLSLAGSANAGQFLETFAEVRAQARTKLNVNSSSAYLTDTVANQYIREGMLALNPMVMYDKEVKTTVTTFKQNTYSLDTMMIGIISVEWAKGDSVKTLKYVPRGQWYEQYVVKTDGKTGFDKVPSFYDNSDDQLFVYPTPTRAGDTIKIYGWQKIGSIDTVSTLTALPESYRMAVLEYVVYVAAQSKGHPATDRFYQNFQRAAAVISMVFNRKEPIGAKSGN